MKRTHTWILSALAVALITTPLVIDGGLGTVRADDEMPRDGATRAPARDQAEPPEMVAKTLDLFIRSAWKEEGLTPRERCTDTEYVRRVYLDVVGTVPNAGQVRTFVKDESEDKRATLVDTLLETPGYSRRMADLWGKTLVGQGTNSNNREYNASLFRNWLESSFQKNRPYGELVKEMIAGTGTVYQNAALNFAGRRDHKPSDLAGAVSKAFLGVQIQCAQCHDHPYEELTQTDFQSFAAFWARTTARRVEIPYATLGKAQAKRYARRYENDVKRLMKEQGMGEAEAKVQAKRRIPKSISVSDIPGGSRFPSRLQKRREQRIGEIAKVTPKFLMSENYADDDGETRRGALADWIASPSNPFTARALANRTWGWFLGRGFVHPVDDFSSVNIPSVPAALDVLAQDTAAHNFDLKRLVRVITATEAYQLSTAGGERKDHEIEFFSAGPLKSLSPQQMFDSLQVSLGVVDDGAQVSSIGAAMSSLEMNGGGGMMMSDDAAKNRSRAQLRGAARVFFQTFDDDEGDDTENFEGTIPQGLFLMNSSAVNGLLTNPRLSVIPKIYDRFESEKERIRHLFQRTLAREPSKSELKAFVKFVKKQPTHKDVEVEVGSKKNPKMRNRRRRLSKEGRAEAAYADVLWTLISTSEYATNH